MGAQNRDPGIMARAEDLRREIARRRDHLVGRQRRRYSEGRQRLIDQLGEDYRAVLAIALRAGAEDTTAPPWPTDWINAQPSIWGRK